MAVRARLADSVSTKTAASERRTAVSCGAILAASNRNTRPRSG
ncbi:hypothetical protein [Phyllobacterium zundukense]